MSAGIAWFVSPHGFGHAARASAVISAVARLRPGTRCDVFTLVPEWFFADSLEIPFSWHELRTDVGLVQQSAIAEDPAATAEALARFFPFSDELLDRLAARLEECGSGVVVCDISPLGLAVARRAGLPAVLIENFTWDWIYRSYFDAEPRLERYAEAFAELFDGADVHLQTRPFCAAREGAVALPVVSRRPCRSPRWVRRELGLDAGRPSALLTMGGGGWEHAGLERLAEESGATLVTLGGAERLVRGERLVRLPDRSPVFTPDLIATVDAVVGKLGYGTVAEAWSAGCRYAWVARPSFPESPLLARFVREELPSVEIALADFASGGWGRQLAELLAKPRPNGRRDNGDDAAAERIVALLRAPA